MSLKKTKALFTSFTSDSYAFVKKDVSGKNKTSLTYLEKALEKNLVTTKNFPDQKIDFLTFDWKSIEMDRNWWWQVQALPFLNWFSQSTLIMSESEKFKYLHYTITAFENWLNLEKDGQDQPLRWHDHATAFRLTYITNWIITIANDDSLEAEFFKTQLAKNVLEVLTTHIHWLSQDENYSKHTNHGFDQALAVYSLGLYVSNSFWNAELKIAKVRLIDEVRFAFTEEGVHKENSPGYHVFMMRRLDKLVNLKQVGDTELAPEAERFREGAKRFLKAITLPDGYLPMVGDTQDKQLGIGSLTNTTPEIHDFSKSGYVVIKGIWRKKSYYILFKNCHKSNYHRHDDDLMVYLQYNNKVILADGGLGSHNEDDKRRKELRSLATHNVPFVDRKPIRNLSKLTSEPKIEVVGFTVIGTSYMYGCGLRRIVDFSAIQDGKIKIKDEFLNHNDCSNPDKIMVNLYFSEEFKDYFNGELLSPDMSTDAYRLPHPNQDEVDIKVYNVEKVHANRSIISRSFKEYQDASRFILESKGSSISQTIFFK